MQYDYTTIREHKSKGLVDLLKKNHSLSKKEWLVVEEAALYENDWPLIGDLFYRNDLDYRMMIFFEELKEYSMQDIEDSAEFSLQSKYPFEYIIALVTGCLETPSKLGGCDHNCGNN